MKDTIFGQKKQVKHAQLSEAVNVANRMAKTVTGLDSERARGN